MGDQICLGHKSRARTLSIQQVLCQPTHTNQALVKFDRVFHRLNTTVKNSDTLRTSATATHRAPRKDILFMGGAEDLLRCVIGLGCQRQRCGGPSRICHCSTGYRGLWLPRRVRRIDIGSLGGGNTTVSGLCQSNLRPDQLRRYRGACRAPSAISTARRW